MADITEDVCAVVNEELIEKVLKNDYGFINGKVKKLDGYDDRNYYIKDVKECSEGIEFPVDGIVIKFINSIDSRNFLLQDAQIKLTQHLENSGIICPMPVLNKYGQYHRPLIRNNKIHKVLVLKYIKGEVMTTIKNVTSELSTDFGSYIGRLTLILKTFNHDGFHRPDHIWALEKSPEVLKFVDVFDQEKQRQIITTILNKFQSDVLLKADNLEKSVIHGDLNVNNVIIENNKILGIIDIGDTVYSFTIFDLAIALCYLILHYFRNNNVNLFDFELKSFVGAYEKQYRVLNDLELSMIHTCICARICQSLVLGKKTSLRDSSNLYILSSQNTGWKALDELMNIKEDKFIKLLGH